MQHLLENIKEYMDMLDDTQLRTTVSELTVAELIEVWDFLNEKEKLRLFLLFDHDVKSEFITELSTADQEFLIVELSEQATKNMLEEMRPDDLVDLIQAISPENRESLWQNMSEESRRETEFLLRFDEDDAAGLMTPRYAAIQGDITVDQALKFIRRTLDKLETIYYIYVVDKLKRLTGVVSLKQILAADDRALIYDIMEEHVIYVRDDTDQEETAKVLEDHDLLALPVVDKFNRLLGIITFDDVIDVIREEQTEDIYKMGAMGGNTDSYLESSVPQLVLKRLPWLVILLLAGTITTNVLSSFNDLILAASFLTLFIPVITQTGGNCGTQSSTLMIRGLATDELHFRDIWKVIGKEIMVGLIIGLSTGVIIFLRGLFLPPGIELIQAITVGISLSAVVIFATVLGALVPLMIHRLGFDPTVAAGPLMSTVIDVIGLTIYFKVAMMILGIG
ncbi:magnesium transporter [Spirochaeta isovalerica]|uniref:Magnesium transporter MgtE n=1 Tax=Spirochaeta isovalerica TaxID=150 RepID=A0A841R7E6_9SPIO|nr:magnesium transporter [Spirochaeta isovalerica]MBB6478422.1 magnesium transporter [Spirochaeta isovalerica]